jgi:hypothetical protein
MIFFAVTLLQEQMTFNDWIDSTQMASQNSELLVSNTLYVKIDVQTSQIALTNLDDPKINLCDSDLLKLD